MSACVDSLSLALGQISFAVNDLTKKNYKATLKEIHEVTIQDLCDFRKVCAHCFWCVTITKEREMFLLFGMHPVEDRQHESQQLSMSCFCPLSFL